MVYEMLLDEDGEAVPNVPNGEAGVVNDAPDRQTAMEEQAGEYMLRQT